MKNKKLDLAGIEVESKVLTTMLESDRLLPNGEKKMADSEIVVTKEDMTEILENKQQKELSYDDLSPNDKQAVDSILKETGKLDVNTIINYASSVQGKLSQFSSQVLENVQTNKITEVGDVLTSLVSNINDFDVEVGKKPSIFSKIFRNAKNQIEKLIAKYAVVETNIDRIVGTLGKNRIQLLKDIAIFEKMFEENVLFYKQISLYIIAGEERIKQLKQVEIVKLKENATQSGNQMDAQVVNDMDSLINSFEKKLYDLRLSRMISIQLAPQIRMLQSNDTELVEKIQSSIINTIPLWKTQLVLALGISNAKLAYVAQRKVTDTTNELLRRNSEILKQGSIEIATESNRARVDLDTIKHVNSNIIMTIEEVLKINADSKEKRLLATKELESAEHDLQAKLFQLQLDNQK